MLITSVRDNENNRRKRNKKNTEKKGVRKLQWKGKSKMVLLCVYVRFSLINIFKASLIFKSNLELALTIVLKEKELYESEHVMVECRCLKIWDLLSFLICFSILVLKWRQVWPI